MLQAVSPRRLLGIGLLACAAVLLTSDIASAQRWGRGGWGRGVGVGVGGVGVGVGGVGVGTGYGGYYGSPGMYGGPAYGWSGYRAGMYPGFSGYSYGGTYPSNIYGYTGTTAYSYPTTGAYATGYASDGCCDPCATGTSGAYMAGAPGTTSQSGYLSPNTEQGLQIVEVHQGPAQTAGIMQGAVIEKVGDTRIRTFNELQTALQNSNNKQAKVTIIDANGQRHVRDVAVKDNKMGVSVVETSVFVPNEGAQPNRQDGTIPQPLPDRTVPDARDPNTIPAPDRTIPPGTTPAPDRTIQPGTTPAPDRTTPPRTTPAPSTTPAPDRLPATPANPNRPKVND